MSGTEESSSIASRVLSKSGECSGSHEINRRVCWVPRRNPLKTLSISLISVRIEDSINLYQHALYRDSCSIDLDHAAGSGESQLDAGRQLDLHPRRFGDVSPHGNGAIGGDGERFVVGNRVIAIPADGY